jgi:hypothetical protein
MKGKSSFQGVRAVGASLLLMGLTGGVLASAQTTLPRPLEMLPATVTVDFARAAGPFAHIERNNNFARATGWPEQRPADVAFLNEQGLHGRLYRVWLTERLYNPTTGVTDYTLFDPYLADASRLSDGLVVNYAAAQLIQAMTPEQMTPVLTRIFLDLKRRYPHIRYIEAFNEPVYNLVQSMRPEQLYPYYVAFYRAVAAVNRELRPAQPLGLGGPALMHLDMPWLRPFLDAYRADRSPDKRLDFLSYHAYGFFESGGGAPGQLRAYHFFKFDPSEVASHRAQVDAELRSRGLDTSIPTFLTEMGLYPGPSFDNQSDPHPDYLRQAAGTAALQYWFLQDPRNVPFNWVVRHRIEERKDELVTRVPAGQPVPTNTFTPYGNMMLMMSRLGSTRVAARSDALSAGKGVYAIATRDRSGVAVMVWNYQHVGTQGYRARLVLDHLPASLQNRPVRQRMYRIDDEISNYWANSATANLQQVSDAEARPGARYTVTVDLTPNALQLVVLEPAAARRH